MKRFILLNSPIFWDTTKEKEQYLSPLGFGYIATYLERAGIDVEVIDCVKETKSVLEIVALINKNKLDYVGINIFTQNYDMVKYIIENIEMGCECFIGGQIVKSIYKELLQGEVSINSWHFVLRKYNRIGERRVEEIAKELQDGNKSDRGTKSQNS